MSPSKDPISVGAYFSGLADYTFTARLGIVDPQLVDYISGLLTRFVRSDALYRVRNPDGRCLVDVGEMLLEAEQRIGDARREVHRHIGDFTLFWAGFYPEALQGARQRKKDDRFAAYCEHGKRAYYVASTIPSDSEEPSADVLVRLSHEFDLCVYGLGEIRRDWERNDEGDEDVPIFTN